MAAYAIGLGEIDLNDWEAAARALRRAAAALDKRPDDAGSAEILISLGAAERRLGRESQAAGAWEEALRRHPGNPAAAYNLGSKRLRDGDADGAATLLRQAVSGHPAFAAGWRNLGQAHLAVLNCRSAEDRPKGIRLARSAFRRSVVLEPGSGDGLEGLGLAERWQADEGGTVRYLRQAHIANPTKVSTAESLGRALAASGRISDGLTLIAGPRAASRFALGPVGSVSDPIPYPVWDGRPLKASDGALLVWCTDAVGEELLFAGLLPHLLTRTEQIVFAADPRLIDLFDRSLPGVLPGVDLVRRPPEGGPPAGLPGIAAAWPLDLAMVYGLARPLDIPTPSLRLQPRHRPVEQKDHDPGRRPKIGIAWRSKNPLIGRLKTMALGEWKAVLSAVDADFVSLQYEDGASPFDARPSNAPAVHSLPVDPFGNLDPLAAEIADLDLVISVASTAVHLAGRLGVPMWVLLPRGMGASWFWFNDGDQSPWYPQARLFRQREPGVWRDPLNEVAAALKRNPPWDPADRQI